VSGDDGEILGMAVGTVGERNRNDRSILPKMQRHKLRAAATQPEVLHSALTSGVRVQGRPQFGVGFQSKKSSYLERMKRCGT
jgi:hypothetical protein